MIPALRRLALRQPLAMPFIDAARVPLALLAALLCLQAALSAWPGVPWAATLQHALTLALIGALTWLAVRLASAIAGAVALRYPVNVADNLQARSIQTQTRVLTRALGVLIGLLGVAAALATFPGARALGGAILASAGVAGLIVGLAARPVLANLLAGLQIAFTQPIRLDDVVIVEGEWGRIEEIGSAFVVVAIWDQRRLVVPLQHFIEKPFQNWTRASSELLGTVFLWVDYRMPLEPLRAELRRVCEGAPAWDGRVCQLVVTEAGERALQLRALVSAADAGTTWDLRCHVRERLIDYLGREWPQYLPRARAELERRGMAAAGPSRA